MSDIPPLSDLLTVLREIGQVSPERLETLEQEFREASLASDSATLARRLEEKGLLFGPYFLLRRLGQGAFTEVHLSLQSYLRRKVALKRFRTTQPAWLPRNVFLAAGLLPSHPNLVTIYEGGRIDETWFLAREYVAGPSLAEKVRSDGPFPVARACRFIRQAAMGVARIHESDLVHRDIKPQHLLLDSSTGVVKLKLSSIVCLEKGHPSRPELRDLEEAASSPAGTLLYAAPEQWYEQVDRRADLFSLGATLAHLLGVLPRNFSREVGGSLHPLAEVVRLHGRSVLPSSLLGILDRLLADRPENRFAEATEVIDALAPLCNEPAEKGDQEPHPSEAPEPALPIRESLEAFQRDLPALLRTTPGQWVAYAGTRQVGRAPTKIDLYRKCYAEGLQRGQFIVRRIQAESDEELV